MLNDFPKSSVSLNHLPRKVSLIRRRVDELAAA